MPGQADAPAPASPLGPLWQAALARPLHSALCGCAVPSAVRLDPVSMELDLLDFVEGKHGLDRLPGWCVAVEKRGIGRSQGFIDWFEFLAGSVLTHEVHAAVRASLENTLRSIAGHAAGRLVPAANLGRGWLSASRGEPE